MGSGEALLSEKSASTVERIIPLNRFSYRYEDLQQTRMCGIVLGIADLPCVLCAFSAYQHLPAACTIKSEVTVGIM